MWTSLQKPISTNKAALLISMLAALGASVPAFAGDGSGMGNGQGGLILLQRNLGNLPGDDGSGLGNGNGDGQISSSLRHAKFSPTATLEVPVKSVKLVCSIKTDPSLKISQKSDGNYQILKAGKSGSSRALFTDKDLPSSLTHLAEASALALVCSKKQIEYSTIDELLKLALKGGLGDYEHGIINANSVIENGSVFLALAYVETGNRKFYQTSDQSNPSLRTFEEVFSELTDGVVVNDLEIPLTEEGSLFRSRKVDAVNIQRLARSIAAATSLAGEQAHTSISVSQPLSIFGFNWKNADAPAISQVRSSLSLSLQKEREGALASSTGTEILIHFNMTSEAKTVLERINNWLTEIQAGDLILSISERPTTISYLSNLEHDLNVLTQFRIRVLDPLFSLSSRSPALGTIYTSLLGTFRARLAASEKAEQLVSTGIGSERIQKVDTRLTSELSTGEFLANQSCGEFNCPSIASDEARLDGLWESFNNIMTLLSTKYPLEDGVKQDIPRLSSEGCKYIPQLIRVLAEFHNNYFIHVREIGVTPKYAGNAYVKQIFSFLEKLNRVHYEEESPAEFLTSTLKDWQKVCTDDLPSIERELKNFRAKPSAEIDSDLRKFKKE